jgi:predicted transposase/invertase (TIGR01784 family)
LGGNLIILLINKRNINMVVVEMGKLSERLNNPVESISWLEAWAMFFNFADKPAYRGLINNLIKTKEEINMATELLMEISQDERERAIMRSRRMYETDRFNELQMAEERGKAEGKAEGREEGMRAERQKRNTENVKRMYQKGYNVATIAEVLDISEKEVKDILGL